MPDDSPQADPVTPVSEALDSATRNDASGSTAGQDDADWPPA